MRIVSWLVVLSSVGWLLAYNLSPVLSIALPAVSMDQVSGTVANRNTAEPPADLNAFATRYTAAWNSHDAARVASFYAPGGRITINQGDPYIGAAGLTAMADGFLTAFPDLELTMDGLEQRDDRVIYQWTFTGTHAETGHQVRISGSESWQIAANGLIADSIGRFDSEEYERQVEHGFHP